MDAPLVAPINPRFVLPAIGFALALFWLLVGMVTLYLA
jgi:hypothetical protein